MSVMSVMSGIFQTVLTLSLTGTFCIFIVLLARILLGRLPRRFSYILWAIAFIRLICPVFPESRFSLIPQTLVSKQAQGQDTLKENANTATVDTSKNEIVHTKESGTDVNKESDLKENQVNNLKKNQGIDNIQNSDNNNNIAIITILSYIWFVGVVILAVYHITSYWRFEFEIKNATEVEKGVKELKGEHLSFVWLAFYLMNKDCEMSCDEKVVSKLGEESKKIYSYALLNEATKGLHIRKKSTTSSLISFGEDGVKSRIKHVLNYKKGGIRMNLYMRLHHYRNLLALTLVEC